MADEVRVGVAPMPAELAGRRAAGRVVDAAVAAAVLALLAVPFGIVALLVRLDSPGPVFYRQRRVGQNGEPFWLYKFRSMRVAAAGPSITAAGDPRVTRVGAFLRRWKIDELPQFWNVLRGDMRLIGPRPEVEVFVRRYTEGEREILRVTPGIAGMAQLAYPDEAELLRGHPDPERVYAEQVMPRKIAIDLEYERGRTFASDLRLAGALIRLVLGWRRADQPYRSPAAGVLGRE